MKFIADIETVNGTEPFNTTPMSYHELIAELQIHFEFYVDRATRVGKTWTIPTTTSTIKIYAVKED